MLHLERLLKGSQRNGHNGWTGMKYRLDILAYRARLQRSLREITSYLGMSFGCLGNSHVELLSEVYCSESVLMAIS